MKHPGGHWGTFTPIKKETPSVVAIAWHAPTEVIVTAPLASHDPLVKAVSESAPTTQAGAGATHDEKSRVEHAVAAAVGEPHS